MYNGGIYGLEQRRDITRSLQPVTELQELELGCPDHPAHLQEWAPAPDTWGLDAEARAGSFHAIEVGRDSGTTEPGTETAASHRRCPGKAHGAARPPHASLHLRSARPEEPHHVQAPLHAFQTCPEQTPSPSVLTGAQ